MSKKIPVSFIFRAMDHTSGPLGKMERKFKGVSDSGKKFNKVFKRSANIAGLNVRQFKALGNNIGKVKNGFSKLAPLAKGMAIAGAITGAGLGIATKDAAAFEKQMSVVKSLTGDISKNEFAALGLEAKKMGALTSFSAQESAQALEYLSLAGFKPQESIGSLEKVLRVAEAGSLGLGLASDILTDSSSALGAAFDKNMGKVERLSILSDQFALAQAKSNTNIEQLGEAVTFGGGSLANMGIPLNQIIAGFGKLADSGIKGSMAGTNMTAMFETLAKPTEKVRNTMAKLGLDMNKLPLNDMPAMLTQVGGALDKLEDGNYKTAIMTEMFGKRGKRAYLSLKEAGVDSLKKLASELENSEGAAERMAKERLNNFSGKFTMLKSSMSGISIEIGSMITQNKSLNGSFDLLIKGTGLFAKSLMFLNTSGADFKQIFKKSAEDLDPFERKIFNFAKDFKEGFSEAFITIKNTFISLKDTFTPLLEQFGLANGGIGKLIGKFVVWSAVLAPVITGGIALAMGLGAIFSAFGGVFSIVSGGIGILFSLGKILWGIASFGVGLGKVFLFITGPIGWTIAAVAALGAGIYALYDNWDGVVSYISDKWQWLTGLLPDSIRTAMGIDVTTKSKPNETSMVNKTMHEIQMGKASAQKNELRVKFDNAPKGTRLETDQADSNLNLDLGFAMEGL